MNDFTLFKYSLELVKALKLLKELLIEAESRKNIDSSVIESLVETSDILGSNLFTKLVDIQNTLGKVSYYSIVMYVMYTYRYQIIRHSL